MSGKNRETAHFLNFFDGFSETRSIEIGGFTCFWGKNLKPVVVSLKPEILAKPKFSGFNEYHHGVSSFDPQKHVNTAIFDRPGLIEYLSKKQQNMSAFPMIPFFKPFKPIFYL